MAKSFFLCLVLLQILPLIAGSTNAYIALQAWKSAITEDPKGILKNWVGSNVCSYKGIFCSNTSPSDPIVVGIDLNHANLKGSLVKELSLFTHLTLIHLNSNRFSGTIPDTIKQFTLLKELDLSNNKFSGYFPTVTLLLPNLIYLDLRYNYFYGTLPDGLFNTNLDAIFLNNNQFQGKIPHSLGNSPASIINFAYNKFSGEIPTSFGYRGPGLKEVLFLKNQLTGCIPQGVGLLNEMEVLDVSHNHLMGHLPKSIGCMKDLELLNLSHNRLSGLVYKSICALEDLQNMTLSFNFFTGVSQECTKLSSDEDVSYHFARNCIPGAARQRSKQQCSMVPGANMKCSKIPPPRPLVCGMLGSEAEAPSPS